MSLSNKRKLIIIEELGDIKVSAAIANWNLAKIIGQNFKNVDILTLDNVAPQIIKQWDSGEIFVHQYKNLNKYHRFIYRNFKFLHTLFQIFRGNDFIHYNRIKNIRFFLNKNKHKYNSILCLSGGLGFSTHQAIYKIKFDKDVSLSGVFHDPYPGSSYPEPYRGGNRFYDFYRRKNLQQAINKLNHVIFPSKKLHEWYLRDYKIEEKKVNIIPHAVDFKSKNRIVQKNKDIIKITHAGTLLKPRNPSVFLKTFVKNSNKDLFVDFYGPIHEVVYKDILPFKKQKNIHILNERISYELAQQKLVESDFMLLIESDAVDSPFLPTKFVEYIVIGLPIIVLTTPNSEVTRLLGNNYPFVSELNNNELISVILKERIKNQKCIENAMLILKGLKGYFSKENIITSYKSILNE
jgi:glycosyltransferase involved in cell wall biosynthesis